MKMYNPNRINPKKPMTAACSQDIEYGNDVHNLHLQ